MNMQSLKLLRELNISNSSFLLESDSIQTLGKVFEELTHLKILKIQNQKVINNNKKRQANSKIIGNLYECVIKKTKALEELHIDCILSDICCDVKEMYTDSVHFPNPIDETGVVYLVTNALYHTSVWLGTVSFGIAPLSVAIAHTVQEKSLEKQQAEIIDLIAEKVKDRTNTQVERDGNLRHLKVLNIFYPKYQEDRRSVTTRFRTQTDKFVTALNEKIRNPDRAVGMLTIEVGE